MGNKAKQRFVELDVNEVSLVDNGANEQEFVVIKNLTTEEVGEMADDNVKKNAGEENAQKDTSPERVPVEVQKSNDAAIVAAMEQVSAMIGNISKVAESASNAGEKSVEKSADGDVEEKPTEKAEGTEAKPAEGDQEVQKDDNAEADAAEADAADTEADVEKTLGALALAVEKAKRFTPKREKAFKAALEALTGLAKELGMMEIAVGASPPVSTPKGAMYGASSVPIAKALEELTGKIEAVVSGVQETTKSLGERVEKIEDTRMPSKSVEGEGGTDTQKTEKSFWSGIL